MPWKNPHCPNALAYRKRWTAQNRRKVVDYSLSWRARNIERVRAYERAYKAEQRRLYPDKNKDQLLRSLYGITVAEREALIVAQNGLCALCGLAPRGRGRCGILHIDHDHNTGRIRALLCSDCNQAIGRLKDSPALCRAAAQYLEKHMEARDADGKTRTR